MRSLRGSIIGVVGLLALLCLPSQALALDIAPEVEKCLAESNKLSVVFMVDGSASLKEFDPEDERVSGIKSVLAALSRVAADESSNKQVEVEVLLSSFFGDTNPKPEDTVGGSGWKTLDPESLGSILEEAESYADRDSGRDTDYALALDNARKLLAQRAAERTEGGGEAPPCDLIVFFTDGEYRVTNRDASGSGLPSRVPYAPSLDLSEPRAGVKAMRLGEEYLCRTGGLVDQLNSEGVVLLTVALAKGGAEIDTTLIESISGEGGDCGSVASLADYVQGATGARLLFDFSDSLTGTSPKRRPLPPCSGEACRAGGRDFTTLEGEKGFKLLASTGSSEEGIRFISPQGESIVINAGDSSEFEASGVSFEPLWLSNTTIDLAAEFDVGSSDWVGDWNVALNTSRRGSRGALHSLSFQADLEPKLIGGKTLEKGEETEVTFQLESADGEPLDPSSPSDVVGLISPSAQLTGTSEGDQSLMVEGPDAELQMKTDVGLSIDETSGLVQIDLELDFPGAAGRDIDPIRESYPFVAKLPKSLGYPEVGPGKLSLPSITGSGSSTGEVRVTGTSGGEGCVWLRSSKVASSPGDVEPLRISTKPDIGTKARCIKVKEGETKEIAVTVSPGEEASGRIEVDLEFGLVSPIKAETKTSTVSASLPVAKEPNVPARILIFVLLIALGATLPVILLHLLNRAGATFSAPQGLLRLQERVELDQGQVRLLDDMGEAGNELEADYESFELVSRSGVEKRVRELQIGSLDFRTIASFSNSPRVSSLMEGPLGVVTSSAGRSIVAGSQTPLRTWEGNRWHEVPLDLPGTWILEIEEVSESLEEDFLSDPEDDETSAIKGVLTLFISYGGSPEQGEALLESAIRKLGDVDWKAITADQPDEERVGGGPLASLRDKFSRRREEASSGVPDSDGAASEGQQTTSSEGDADSWYDDDDW